MDDQVAAPTEIMNGQAFDDGSFKLRYERDGALFVLELERDQVQELGRVLGGISPLIAPLLGGGLGDLINRQAAPLAPLAPIRLDGFDHTSDAVAVPPAGRNILIEPTAGAASQPLTNHQLFSIDALLDGLDMRDEAGVIAKLEAELGTGWGVRFADLPGGYRFYTFAEEP